MSNLAGELEKWFQMICNIILRGLGNDYDSIRYLYQVEEIVRNHKEEYTDLLAENIQDFYIQHSETTEARINHKIASKSTDNLYYLMSAKADEQHILDEWLYEYENTEAVNNKIKKKLRYGQNTQTSLERYLYPEHLYSDVNVYIDGLPAELTVAELLDYEIDQAVVEYMTNEIFTASESTMERVTQEIYDIIRESYAEQGEGIPKVTEEIQTRFTELATHEAERIARTETLKAQSHATWKRLVNNPEVEYIQWISTADDKTRDSHLELHGQITYADGNGVFSNGLQYPGDTNGDIEEWINCRCDPVAFVPDLGMVPPAGADNWYEDEMLFDTSLEIPTVIVEVEEYLASYW